MPDAALIKYLRFTPVVWADKALLSGTDGHQLAECVKLGNKKVGGKGGQRSFVRVWVGEGWCRPQQAIKQKLVVTPKEC